MFVGKDRKRAIKARIEGSIIGSVVARVCVLDSVFAMFRRVLQWRKRLGPWAIEGRSGA